MESIVVLLSVYNGERFLEEQLDSILRQEGVFVRILIRIDGSHDRSYEILQRYQSSYPEQIEIIVGNNQGFALSFTRLLEEAYVRYQDSRYFAFADQDDVWLPDKLATGIRYVAKENTSIPVAYCCATRQVNLDLQQIGDDNVLDPKKITKPRALVQNFSTGCTMVFNRKAVELYIENEPDEIKVHDFLMYQICVFLGKMIYDPTPHILYRQHGKNQIGHPEFLGRMKNRFKCHFKDKRLSRQSYYFYEAFNHLLSKNDSNLIKNFFSYRSSLISRLKLLFNK